MQTADYITRDVNPLSPTDKVSKAKELFNKLTFTHLPVVDGNTFIGSIAESDIQTIDELDKPISDYNYYFQSFFVGAHITWFELLKIFALNDSSIIPVLDEDHNYMGYFELADILHIFNSTPFLNENGATLVVSKGQQDFSFSQVAQIIETNDSKLLGAFISNFEEDTVEITLKLSEQNLNSTIQTFRRYGYNVLTNFHLDTYLNTLKERSEYLQRYLNI